MQSDRKTIEKTPFCCILISGFLTL